MLNKDLNGYRTLTVCVWLLAAPGAWADPPGARAAVFGDWRIDCTVALACAGVTSVHGADGSDVLRLTVTAGRAPALSLTTPLPLFLPDGLMLALGDRPERLTAWRTCTQHGCETTLPIDPELRGDLRRERAGTAALTLAQGDRVRLPFSLMGVSAVLRALAAGGVSP